jgi:hypothetical protein
MTWCAIHLRTLDILREQYDKPAERCGEAGDASA